MHYHIYAEHCCLCSLLLMTPPHPLLRVQANISQSLLHLPLPHALLTCGLHPMGGSIGYPRLSSPHHLVHLPALGESPLLSVPITYPHGL